MLENIAAVRGAVQIAEDTDLEIRRATVELFDALTEANDIHADDIISIIISCTRDIRAYNPATALRIERKIDHVPLFCVQEFDWDNAPQRIIRFLLHLSSELTSGRPQPVYLGGAGKLRPDLTEQA